VTPADILDTALLEQIRARAIVAGLRPCPVVLSHAWVTLGAFVVDKHTGATEIRISRHLSEADQVRETARHELAHQAAWERYGHFGHGPLWQTFASYIGCEPVRCAQFDTDAQAAARYAITCTHCSWATTRLRRSKLVRTPWRYTCASCGSKLRVLALSPAR
jgi:predicted SprT family Zn-dependent metalloprotease